MTKLAALGDGPIVFFSDGVQVEVPLSAIFFENDEVYTMRRDLTGFDKWIKFLASRKRLVAGVAPAPAKAIVVTAVLPGAFGNTIQLTVTPKSAAGVVDVTVTETDKYEGLKLATLTSRLGITSGEWGIEPGLLRVKTNPNPTTTANPVASPTPIVAIPGAGGALPTWTIAGAAATAVMLEPRRTGTTTSFDTADFKVLISDVQPASGGGTSGGTFTLTVTWARKVENMALATISTDLAALGYVVAFTAPDGAATVTKLPRSGTVTLTGGSEIVAATAASATVMANE